MQRHRHQEFIRFLNTIEADIPAGKVIHVVLDNYATHKHAKVRAWLDRHPRFVFHYTPTSASWLNAVEGFFAKLAKRRLKRGVFRSIVDLQTAINRFLRETNDDPKPFTWAAEPAGTYFPGNGCPDGIHYDVKGNLWAASARLGGMLQIDPRGIILGFVPIPNSDLATTNFAFGGPDSQYIYFEGAISGTFWKFKAPYPGLIGPGGVRLPAQ